MKKVGKAFAVFAMLAVIFGVLTNITLKRTGDGCVQLSDFYKLDQDTVDVLFVGSSHVYYSINTCHLYGQYGIASYLMASPGQPVWLSYYLLEEAFKTQHPKLVVFDIYTLYRTVNDAGYWECLLGMKPSLTKWNAIKAVKQDCPQVSTAGVFLAFPYYHTRYAQLERQDYENTGKASEIRYNGYKPDFTVISKKAVEKWGQIDRKGFQKAAPVSGQVEAYLRKLIQLCQNKGVPLLMVNAPFANQMLEKQQAYNYVGQIAKEYGVPLVDGNAHIEKMQIDFSKDLIEASHLNYSGALKYTDYLAREYLQGYGLPDRRGDARFQNWEAASEKLVHSQLYRERLQGIQTLEEYQKALEGLEGCLVAAVENPDGEAVVYEDGRLVFEGAGGTDYWKYFEFGPDSIAVCSSNGVGRILLNAKEYSKAGDQVCILAYDKVTGCLVDQAGFDKSGKRVKK